MKLTEQEKRTLDDACALLQRVARDGCVSGVEIDVRVDGRVTMIVGWGDKVNADLVSGGAYAKPGDALSAFMNGGKR